VREAHLRFGTGVQLPAAEAIVVADALVDDVFGDALGDAFGAVGPA
jgi:ribonuclease HII